MNKLKVYALPESPLESPGNLLLSMIWRIERDCWTGAGNAGAMILCLGWCGLRWLHRGDAVASWLIIQLALMPILAAIEEFLHLAVMIRKGISPRKIDLAVVYLAGRSGFPWFCWGAAARVRVRVPNQDRIHIAVPGPVLSLVLLGLVWLVCTLLDGHLWWGGAHRMALPTLSYLAGAWLPVPVPAAPTPDAAAIWKAGREEGYSVWVVLGECQQGLRYLWGRRA